MDIRKLHSYWVLFLLPLIMGCPLGDEKCPFNDWERITTIEDMLDISPMKNSFRIGEEVNISITIPDTVYMWNNAISLINETNDYTIPHWVSPWGRKVPFQ